MNYQLITDMSIDIDADFAAANHVAYIPMDYLLGDETHHCLGPESNEQMHLYYDKLRDKVTTKTSQISPYNYMEAFEPYVKEGIPLLYLSLSSGLSDTYQSAHTAVNMLRENYDHVQIELVDTLGATGGVGLLMESAVENQKAGMSLTENADWLRHHAGLVNYWFKVEDLMYLMRGGRISASSAIIGSALNIKPILTIRSNGKLETVAKKRGNRQAFNEMVSRFKSNFDPSVSQTVYISCADCTADAEKLKETILGVYPELNVKITMLSPIIGAHTGPDMAALIYYGKNRV